MFFSSSNFVIISGTNITQKYKNIGMNSISDLQDLQLSAKTHYKQLCASVGE